MSNQIIIDVEKLKAAIGKLDSSTASAAIDSISQYFDDYISKNEAGKL